MKLKAEGVVILQVLAKKVYEGMVVNPFGYGTDTLGAIDVESAIANATIDATCGRSSKGPTSVHGKKGLAGANHCCWPLRWV